MRFTPSTGQPLSSKVYRSRTNLEFDGDGSDRHHLSESLIPLTGALSDIKHGCGRLAMRSPGLDGYIEPVVRALSHRLGDSGLYSQVGMLHTELWLNPYLIILPRVPIADSPADGL